jgi:hypothetical protein
LSYLPFLVYLVLCGYLLTRIRFVKNAGISTLTILTLFCIKTAVGCFNVAMSITHNGDSMKYFNEGFVEYQLLRHDPKAYFLDIFQSGYTKPYAGLFQTHDSYWNDLKDNIMAKLISVLDIFSQGNMFTSALLYNFITFFGIIALFRVFDKVYPGKKNLLIICFFLLPSLLFFSSAVHKEGLMFAAIGIIVFNTYYALNISGFSLKRIVYIALPLLFICLVRNYVFMALVPALFAWIWVHSGRYRPLLSFTIIYLVGIIVFFNLGKLSSSADPAQIVTGRRGAFNSTTAGNTQVPLDTLYPTFKSFVYHAPQAIDHSILRPRVSDIHMTKLLIPSIIEIHLYILLLLFLLFLYRGPSQESGYEQKLVVLFSLFFSVPVLLMIGYTVPNIGAIVRYRSIYLPFVVTPLFCALHSALIKKGYNKQLRWLFLS